MLEARLAVCAVLGLAGSTVAQPYEPTARVELAWLTDQSGLAIVGAELADPHGVDGGGESYVVFGREQFPAELKLSNLDGENGFTIFGDEFKDGAGYAVAGAGDVNGDGLADLIIGAWPAGEDAPMDVGPGIAYVVTDRTRPDLRLNALGTCPGRLKIRASIVDPRGNAAVFFSRRISPDVVPWCIGCQWSTRA